MNIDKLTRTLAKFLGTSESELLDGFRPAESSELGAVSELRDTSLNESQRALDVNYLNWRFCQRDPGAMDLWVCKPKNEILAIVGLERMHFIKGDEQFEFVRIIDLYVAPHLQKFGVAAWMCLRIKELYPRVMVIGSNENSLSVTQKLWPSINILQKYKKPLGVDGVFTGSRFFRSLTQFSLIRRLAVAVNDLLMRRKLSALNPEGTLVVYNSPAELSAALDAHQPPDPKLGFRMQTRRDGAFINWRFAEHPWLKFRATALLDLEGRVLAYLVASAPQQLINGKTICMQRTYLVDWRVFDDESGASLAKLILEYALHASSIGTFLIEAQTTDSSSRRAMQMAGFWARERDARFFVYDSNQDWSNTTNDEWFITWADTDQIDQFEDYASLRP